ncbi:MAG: T9SS type A sorting domain-containing protein [bacterium]|nr:T9SS type A sorting domain-containing protein [bacterium]
MKGLSLIFIMLAFLLFMSGNPIASPGTNENLIELVPDASFVCKNKEERCGYSMFAAGDVNRDGFDDFMVAAYHNYLHGWNSGGVYLITGGLNKTWGFNANIESAATAIFRGSQDYDMVGYSVAGKGDFNGDGYDDLIIGAPGTWDRNPETPGWAYLVFGKKEMSWGQDCQLALSADVKIEGEKPLDQLGYANSFVGDINHDGFDDILTSAPYRNQYKKWDGKAYLILGDSAGWHDKDTIAKKAVASFYYPLEEALTGYSVAGVGDVNQDGTPDFVIGVPGANVACLILGRSAVDWGHNFNLENADYKFWGEIEGDYAGSWISAANDVNHDGYPDFLISAIKSYFEGGRIYLILGRNRWDSRDVSLKNADASFMGEDQETHTGFCTSGLLDYDGDGFDDFLIGARYLNHPDVPHAGKLYLIKGKADGWQHDLDLGHVPDYFWGTDTITCAGWQVVDVGDVNGDYAHDFATSGPFNSTGAHWGGKIYFFYGKNSKCQIRGAVNYYSHQHPVPDVKLALTGDVSDSTMTNRDGMYAMALPINRNFIAVPSKRLEQKNDYYTVSAYDAALTARYAVKIDTLSHYSVRAADVDQDQNVTMYDAAQIARFAVDLPALEGSKVGLFCFDPQRRLYQQTQGIFSNEDYAALVLGDVDGNWMRSSLNRTFVGDNLLILPEKVFAYLNSEIEIPIRTSAPDSILSADIQIHYNPACLTLLDVSPTEVSKNFQLVYNQLAAGKIKVALYALHRASLSGELIRIKFRVSGSAKQRATELNVPLFWLNGFMFASGKTTIYLVDKKNLKNSVELTAQPNPFNPSTKIYFQNTMAGIGQIQVFDMLGREVWQFSPGYLSPGTHEIFWDGKDNNGTELASGVYFVKFICENETNLKKIIKLK